MTVYKIMSLEDAEKDLDVCEGEVCALEDELEVLKAALRKASEAKTAAFYRAQLARYRKRGILVSEKTGRLKQVRQFVHVLEHSVFQEGTEAKITAIHPTGYEGLCITVENYALGGHRCRVGIEKYRYVLTSEQWEVVK